MADFEPTQQQKDVTEFFKQSLINRSSGVISIFLDAVAGSGKSSTIMLQIEALKALENQMRRRFSACSLSFNVNIRDANSVKLKALGSRVLAKTTNQLGRGILVAAAKSRLCMMPADKADTGKYRLLAQQLLASHRWNGMYFPDSMAYNKAVTGLCILVDAVRATRVDPNEEALFDLIFHYDLSEKIDINAPWCSLVMSLVVAALDEGIEEYRRSGGHDFNDQIWFPLALGVAAPLYDVIFIDEAQDLNRARMEMICKSIKPGGVLFFVGDPYQAIQGFTFTDTDSVATIKNLTQAVSFPLSVCWRCDSDIIRLAQVLVPHIEARPGAPAGVVDVIEDFQLVDRLQPGDLCLCRVNAALVKWAIKCFEDGKRVTILGRDIGKSFVSLVDDIASESLDIEGLEEAIRDYIGEKILALFGKEDSERQISDWNDRRETLLAFLDGYFRGGCCAGSIAGFKRFIEDRFSDDGSGVIVFSTVHKAKGLEYGRVFVLEPRLLPHPAASPGWQSDQERNIIYVAITRAKHELYFVGGVPGCLMAKYNEIKGIVPGDVAVDDWGWEDEELEDEEEVSFPPAVAPVAPAPVVIEEVLALPSPAAPLVGAPEFNAQGELSDEYIESVLAPVLPTKKKKGRPTKDLERVNVKLSPVHLELTTNVDRSALIRQLLDAHFGLSPEKE